MAFGRGNTPNEEPPEDDWWIDESWPGPHDEGLIWALGLTSGKIIYGSSVGMSLGSAVMYYTNPAANSDGNNITWAIDPTR